MRGERGMQGPVKPPPQWGLGCLSALSNECQRVIVSLSPCIGILILINLPRTVSHSFPLPISSSMHPHRNNERRERGAVGGKRPTQKPLHEVVKMHRATTRATVTKSEIEGAFPRLDSIEGIPTQDKTESRSPSSVVAILGNKSRDRTVRIGGDDEGLLRRQTRSRDRGASALWKQKIRGAGMT